MTGAPQPLPYQQAVVDLLRTEHPEVWDWFASNRVRSEHADSARLELLKKTYRLEPQTHARPYELATAVRDRLELTAPVTLYQMQQADEAVNAAVRYVPGEVHLVFMGPILDRLDDAELTTVLAHELAHFVLYDGWDSRFLIAAQALDALGGDGSSDYVESARLMTLFTEVFCDRTALHVAGDLEATVAALIKVSLGLTDVSVESYLRQAEEIAEKGDPGAEGATHPELFLRARALRLWAERGDDASEEIERIIRGPLALATADLLGRKRLRQITRRMVDDLLAPSWLRTDATLAHAKLFFPDYKPPAETPETETAIAEASPIADEIAAAEDDVKHYCTAVLLDFATADRSLDELPLARCLLAARDLGLQDRLAEMSVKELGLGQRKIDTLIEQAAELVRAAGASAGDAEP